jgi:rRNA pseudouridine-1189 N-methylase Emg1 (Nep1/Mra1 family)
MYIKLEVVGTIKLQAVHKQGHKKANKLIFFENTHFNEMKTLFKNMELNSI